jgi:NAD-dependent dihydropyrimidine dehydrogenase PreA subunit
MKKPGKSTGMKRRDFLKAGAAVGAAATIGGTGEVLKGAENNQDKVYILPNVSTPNRPVIRNAEICNGCNTCVNVCQVDVYVPNPLKGMPPLLCIRTNAGIAAAA